MFPRKPIEDLICKLASLQMPNRSQEAREGQEMILSLDRWQSRQTLLSRGHGFSHHRDENRTERGQESRAVHQTLIASSKQVAWN